MWLLQSHSENEAHWDGECALPPQEREGFMLQVLMDNNCTEEEVIEGLSDLSTSWQWPLDFDIITSWLWTLWLQWPWKCDLLVVCAWTTFNFGSCNQDLSNHWCILKYIVHSGIVVVSCTNWDFCCRKALLDGQGEEPTKNEQFFIAFLLNDTQLMLNWIGRFIRLLL